MITEAEIEAMIYETAAGLARKFLHEDRENDLQLPRGAIEEAVKREIVYIGKITAIFEGALREMIPHAYPDDAVIEGQVVS